VKVLGHEDPSQQAKACSPLRSGEAFDKRFFGPVILKQRKTVGAGTGQEAPCALMFTPVEVLFGEPRPLKAV
jgi:hypothetical protein